MTEKTEEYPQCYMECKKSGSCCHNSGCKMWIDFEEDYNCSLISIEENGPMTLDQISKRLKVSLVRISQIEKKALTKISKRIKI